MRRAGSNSVRWVILIFALSTAVHGAAPTTAQVQDAAKGKQLSQLAARVEPRLRELLSDPSHANADELIRLSAVREFGRYFARVETMTEGQADTVAWLAGQPKLMEMLMLHAGRADPPDRVLEVLRSLREDHRAKMEEFAELTTAMCVVWDAPERFGPDEDAKIESERICRVFAHFIDKSTPLRVDLHKTPVELLVYVVDLDLTDQEIAWAAARYGKRPNVAAVMHEVPYHENVGYDKSRDAVDEHSYLLPNILRSGGTSDEGARFAAQVGKAVGVPTAIGRAAGVTDGPATAWVCWFEPSMRPAWDFVSSRYPEHVGFAGEVSDPQSYSALPEAEVAVTAGLMTTAARDRLASLALCKSADLAQPADSPTPFERAVELSPCNRTAWFALAQLAAARKLSAEQNKRLEKLIAKQLHAYPGFALLVRLRMLKGRGLIEFSDGIQRLKIDYGDRPELVAQVLMTLSDRQRDDGRTADAVTPLLELLRLQGRSGPAALTAMLRLEPLLRKTDELPRLAEIYREVWTSLPRPAPTRWGRTTPYYRIGEKFAMVLDELHSNDAGAVRTKISNVVISE